MGANHHLNLQPHLQLQVALVRKLARQHKNVYQSCDVDELVAAGNLLIVELLELGAQLSTPHLTTKIKFVFRQQNQLHSAKDSADLNRIRDIVLQLEQEGLPVSPEVVSRYLRIDLQRIKSLWPQIQETTSLNQSRFKNEEKGGDGEVQDSLKSEEDFVEVLIQRDQLQKALAKLDATELNAIQLVYGLEAEALTLSQVSKKLGISVGKLNKILVGAMQKMRS